MKYDVYVLTHNEELCISSCIKSIKRFCKNRNKIKIIDDNSEDDTLKYAEPLVDEVIANIQGGVGTSRQIALETTETDYILFVDADVELIRDPEPILNGFNKNDKAIAIRGRNLNMVNWDYTMLHKWGCGMGLTFVDVKKAKDVGFKNYIYSGGKGEDKDFCIRAKEKGYVIGANNKRVFGIHFQSYELNKEPELMYDIAQSFINGNISYIHKQFQNESPMVSMNRVMMGLVIAMLLDDRND
jgi:glycosyltransferase involved in cell wall biosynthesis